MGIATNVVRNTARAARRHDRTLFRLLAAPDVPDLADEPVGRPADAEALGIPVGAVRSRLSRARARLRKLAAQEPAKGGGGRAGGRAGDPSGGASVGPSGPGTEPPRGSGQVQGGRGAAVRSAEGWNR